MHTVHLREHNVHTGLLRFPSNRYTRAIRVRPSVISIMPCFDPERLRVVQFIESGYRRAFGARISVGYPTLISLRTVDDVIISAAGFRFASRSPLFLEQYIDQPIEGALSCERRDIAEVGNLMTCGAGSSIFLFSALASYLYTLGIRYVALTGTTSLEHRLHRLELSPRRLCPADPARVIDTGDDWGSYYYRRPWVLAGEVAPAFDKLRELFGQSFFIRRPRLFPRLHHSRSGL